jgi:hypothetical protein
MREVQTGRDATLPPPRVAPARQLGPGERIVDDKVMYSAAWLSAPRVLPSARDIEPGEVEVHAAEPRPLPAS